MEFVQMCSDVAPEATHGKVLVTMVFEVEHTDECNGDMDEFVKNCGAWAKDDPVGWLLNRPTAERFAIAVSAVPAPNTEPKVVRYENPDGSVTAFEI